LNTAIQEYSRAFALAEGKNGNVSRTEIRKKLGNVWRLAHGSNDGLGEYLLRTYDDVLQASIPAKPRKNADARETADFLLRKAPDGTPFPLKDTKGKVLVVNFWATWCGPCRAMEPRFERVAAEFQGLREVLFLSVNCDEDETLVPAYLEREKLRTTVVFADGLDRLLAVSSFPTIIILDRSGKIAYRAEGFDPDGVEKDLAEAVNRAVAPAKDSSSAGTSNP
jgi:thiol-disulfide isomerase/thioredoxin